MLDNKETTQNYFKGLTRKDYIERVCKIMEKDGAEDLSIRRIAKELGCSSAALYRYFNSKSELEYYVSLNTAGGIYYPLESGGKKPGEEYGISMWVYGTATVRRLSDIQKIIIDCFLNIRMNIWVEL